MTDIDRKCLKQERELEFKINKIQELIERFPNNRKCNILLNERNYLLSELYEMQRCHNKYDSALSEAFRDPTGQDLDNFCFSE